MNKSDWLHNYKNRQVKANEAISVIQSHNKVFLAPFCNEPQTLVEELVRQKDRFEQTILYTLNIGSPCLYATPDAESHFIIHSFLHSARLKQAYENHFCDYLPVNLSQIPAWLKENPVDVALIQVSSPDEFGKCHLGISVDIIHTLIEQANIVIAQVNEELPVTHGDVYVDVAEIDHFVLSNRPLLDVPSAAGREEEKIIGQYVAEIIPHRATIQVGVGRLADSILGSLKEKRDLGIHSGSITDMAVDLMESGVVTNAYKEINQHQTICTTLTGTKRLYAFAHQNEAIHLQPVEYTHNPAVIAQINQFYSINSALEVDLLGNVNAEQAGRYPLGGVGGQMDFILGSRLSTRGRSIIALPSTAKKGTESRIRLSTSFVTSVKSEIDYVVTEYGVASLFGKTVKERAAELLAIAHPAFKDKLEWQVKQNGS
ncbi:acetyl-CoA hydrolase [Pradoshia eiseniae]|uniref:Acetyl-CoA hydrolase n=1 Tax=Pradoshia eiseniae TaxID=2064768 RepID=A0A2S7MXM4_9BACI|nr:acetyl-CoA hydrolase/transferase C-terminal domain-containing protein [Pradoshia eiseniae]PQD94554.1 acetyl-CoA hydrolase [Pradoshia eiseniae]